MDELKVFRNLEFGELEVWIGPDKKPWFPATESATMLGYADPHKAIAILLTPDALSVTQIAKDYGKSAQWLNAKFHDLGVQYNQSDQWVLYQTTGSVILNCTE